MPSYINLGVHTVLQAELLIGKADRHEKYMSEKLERRHVPVCQSFFPVVGLKNISDADQSILFLDFSFNYKPTYAL